jgi:hypothetical protein
VKNCSRYFARSSPERSEGGDDDLYYEITLATSRLISVAWDDWEYGHGAVGCGAAHPNSHAKVETLMLSPVPHPMQPSGLFRQRRYGPNKVAPDTRWTDPIFFKNTNWPGARLGSQRLRPMD